MGDATTDTPLAPAPASPPQESSTSVHMPASRPHPLVICDACDQNVMGTRYRCISRENVDLCEACFWSGSEASLALRAGQEWMRMSYVSV